MTLWNDPTGRALAARQFTGGLSALDHYGEDVWDCITWLGREGRNFTVTELVADFSRQNPHLAARTANQYVRAFWCYARAAQHTFSGPQSRLHRVHPRVWRLVDGPEL